MLATVPLTASLCASSCIVQMGALLLLGCVMIGFALPAALFALLLMRRSQLVIVMLARSATRGQECRSGGKQR